MRVDPTKLTTEELQIIADLAGRMVELRQKGCTHLSVENVAPEMFRDLLEAYSRWKLEDASR